MSLLNISIMVITIIIIIIITIIIIIKSKGHFTIDQMFKATIPCLQLECLQTSYALAGSSKLVRYCVRVASNR